MKFEASRLKLERAMKHTRDVLEIIESYRATDFFDFSVQREGAQQFVELSIRGEIPKETALAVGDAIHNLRSALDLMACDLVRDAGHDPDRWTTFPIRSNRSKVEATINRGALRFIKPALVAAILDEIKPYCGGNDQICALHELDVLDKHRLLIPCALLAVSSYEYTANGAKGSAAGSHAYGTKMRVGPFPADTRFTYDDKPSVDFFFGVGPLERKQLVPALLHLMDEVRRALDTVQAAT